jgi:hypothetical protein
MLLPTKSNLPIAQAAAIPKTRLQGTPARDKRRQADGGQASGS